MLKLHHLLLPRFSAMCLWLPGDLIKIQILIPYVWGRVCDSAFLTSSRVALIQLVPAHPLRSRELQFSHLLRLADRSSVWAFLTLYRYVCVRACACVSSTHCNSRCYLMRHAACSKESSSTTRKKHKYQHLHTLLLAGWVLLTLLNVDLDFS